MNFKIAGGFKLPGALVVSKCKNRRHDILEDYFNNMPDPLLIDNGDDTITVKIKPVPAKLAQLIVDSKSVYFGIIRVNAGEKWAYHDGHWGKNKKGHHGRKSSCKRLFTDYFLDYYSPDYCGTLTFLNTTQDQINLKLTKEELMAGQITRDISHLFELDYEIWAWNKDDWIAQFYLGIYYRDEEAVPTLFKMQSYDIWCEL